MIDLKIAEIVDQFQIEGEISSIESFGDGHINDTYQIVCNNSKKSNYILQRVNNYVFKNIKGLMNNISLVTTHLRNKLVENNIKNVEEVSLELIKTKYEKVYFEDSKGKPWRLFNFIKDHKVFDGVPDTDIAFEGARMFGKFINDLSDLDTNNIVETIPNFHNIAIRLDQLELSIEQNVAGRVSHVKDEINYARSRREIMSRILNLGEKGLITQRIVHNDTKINNVLFDQKNKGICVVDLDTIMPGFVHYDFGDGVRTCANTGLEDDRDLKNVSYDLEMYKAFSCGFIESVNSVLNDVERNTLAQAALLFPFIMGVRFLIDYISGDIYYKTKYENHNMIRAKAQLKLTSDGESKLKELEKIVQNA